MGDRNLRLPIRFQRHDRLYGPGMPSYTEEGVREKLLEKPFGQTGLVSVHCWNLGQATGPYPIGPDAHCPGKVADWVPTAHEVVRDCIRPTFDAARAAGIPIFHIGTQRYAPRYAQYLKIKEDPELQPPAPAPKFETCVRPWTGTECKGDVLSPNFPGAAWDTHPDQFDIAEAVKPLPSEPVVLDGWQLNGLCRRMDIDTLFYVGFMADICLLNVPGALREMSSKFRYRCVVLRDCTTAYEYPDTYKERWMTRIAIRQVEGGLGYSSESRAFIEAVQKAR